MSARRGSPRATARIVLAAVFLAVGARAASAESRYSLNGDGEWVSSSRADARALGSAEIAARVPSLGRNPATLAFADRTTFYGTYDLEWIRTQESATGFVRKDYANLVPNLALIFPLPGGLRLGTGLLIDRRRSGTIDLTASVNDGNGGTLTYRQVFEGTGSFLRIPALLAWDAGRAQVGAGVDLLLLGSDVTWRNDFSGAGAAVGFVSSEDREENSLDGIGFRGGIRVPLGDRLSVGAYTALPSRLSGEDRFSSAQAGATRERVVDRSVDVAPVWGAGAEVRPVTGLRVAADWVHEAWDKADPLNPTDRFVNVNRAAIGAEWKRTGERGTVELPIRAGYRTELLHTLDAEGQEVREHVLSAGSGFDIAGGRGGIDWYLEYGWRGRKNTNEYQEHFVRFGVTLTGWEKWTRPERPAEGEDW